jgi:hypothetical protein
MKKQILLLVLSVLTINVTLSQEKSVSRRQVITSREISPVPHKPLQNYTMDFESVDDFSLTFATWGVRDIDSSNTFAITGHVFPHDTDPMAFICFNPAKVQPAMTDAAIQPHGGQKFGACFSAVNPPNKDWFISPKIRLAKGGSFSFWVKSYTSDYGLEKYKVGISTATNNPADFTFISGTSPLAADTSWTRKTFSLSDYNDTTVYVAIQCVSDTAFIFMIDDLEVDAGDTVEQLPNSAYLDFEQINDFSLDFTPWTVRDVNGGATYGIENCYFPNNGSPMAFINFNPSKATPPPLNMTPYTGNKFGASFSSIPPNNPNNKWLISPKIELKNNPKISLWVETYNLQYGYEKFNIGVSTTGTDPSDFTIISGPKPDSARAVWENKIYSLGDYAGEQVYVGIQCVTNNGFCFMVDDIEISSTVGLSQDGIFAGLAVYPVPASDKIYCKDKNDHRGDVTVEICTITGSRRMNLVTSRTGDLLETDVSGLPEGMYLYRIIDKEGIRSGKFLIKR